MSPPASFASPRAIAKRCLRSWMPTRPPASQMLATVDTAALSSCPASSPGRPRSLPLYWSSILSASLATQYASSFSKRNFSVVWSMASTPFTDHKESRPWTTPLRSRRETSALQAGVTVRPRTGATACRPHHHRRSRGPQIGHGHGHGHRHGHGHGHGHGDDYVNGHGAGYDHGHAPRPRPP